MKVSTRVYYGNSGEFNRDQVDIDPRLDEQSKQIINSGLQFTIEYIGLIHRVSICLEDYDRGDYKIEFSEVNKEEIQNVIENIIENFSIQDYQRWCEEFDNYDLQFED